MSIGKRIVCLLLCMILLLLAAFGAAEIRTVQHSEFDYVFVHGLVNTVSAMAPAGAPSAVYSEEELLPGIWYLMPTYRGDHMLLQGGMTKHNNIRPFYMELLEMIDALP